MPGSECSGERVCFSASVFLLLLCNDCDILELWLNRAWLGVVAVLIIGLVLIFSLVLAMTTLFPIVNVTVLSFISAAVLIAALLVGALVYSLRPGKAESEALP